jgi:DNA-directed RNA polymerase subunit N (RpoN/RPB10)
LCNNNSSSKGLYKHNQCKRDNASLTEVIEPIHCRECGKSILGVYNYNTQRVTAYEKYNYPYLKTEHEHPADVVTKIDVEHRTAVEFRYIRARLIRKSIDISGSKKGR